MRQPVNEGHSDSLLLPNTALQKKKKIKAGPWVKKKMLRKEVEEEMKVFEKK
jgi:hypothetical protein